MPVGGKPEDPGSLKVYGFKDGVLTNKASVPAGHRPRLRPAASRFPSDATVGLRLGRAAEPALRLSAHARRRAFGESRCSSRARLSVPTSMSRLQDRSTCTRTAASSISATAVRWSSAPSAWTQRCSKGGPCSTHTNSNIACFAINQENGEPTLIDSADTHGAHPRTFSIDAEHAHAGGRTSGTDRSARRRQGRPSFPPGCPCSGSAKTASSPSSASTMSRPASRPNGGPG